MWIEQSHIWPFRLNITFGWLQKLNPGYKICIISYQVNLSSEVSAMFNSLMPSLNIRSLPFVVILGGFPSRCQNLSSGAIRPGGLLSSQRDVLTGKLNNNEFHVWIFTIKFMRNCYFKLCLQSTVTYVHVSWFKRDDFIVLIGGGRGGGVRVLTLGFFSWGGVLFLKWTTFLKLNGSTVLSLIE